MIAAHSWGQGIFYLDTLKVDLREDAGHMLLLRHCLLIEHSDRPVVCFLSNMPLEISIHGEKVPRSRQNLAPRPHHEEQGWRQSNSDDGIGSDCWPGALP